MSLHNKNILLGISGGIAAYKTPDLVRKLKAQGANVRTVLTQSAKSFVSPLALQAVSGHEPAHDLLDPAAEAAMGHIELAKWADAVMVAPATANIIAKITHGIADDLLTTLCLATPAPVYIAPAMNQQMWAAAANQSNLKTLTERGVTLFGPGEGEQACGDVGLGRMLEPEQLVELLGQQFQPQLLAGKHVIITAGPTRENIDPVRYISNHSSGKMGYALASAAMDLGAKVTLVSGPVNLAPPAGCHCINVSSAEDMLSAVMDNIASSDIFIGCAAVADYKPDTVADQKIKKNNDKLTLTLTKNPDILASVAALPNKPYTLGFAAETQDVEHYALGKLKNKGLDMIAANDVSDQNIGFNSDDNALTVLWPEGKKQLTRAGKYPLSLQLLTLISQQLQK